MTSHLWVLWVGLEQEMEKVGTIPIVPTFSISTREKKEGGLYIVTVSSPGVYHNFLVTPLAYF